MNKERCLEEGCAKPGVMLGMCEAHHKQASLDRNRSSKKAWRDANPERTEFVRRVWPEDAR